MLACANTLKVTFEAESRYFLELSPSEARSWKSNAHWPKSCSLSCFGRDLQETRFHSICACVNVVVVMFVLKFFVLFVLSLEALSVPRPPMNLERWLGIFHLRYLCILCLLCCVVLFRFLRSFLICLPYLCLCLNPHEPSKATKFFQLVFVMFFRFFAITCASGCDSIKFVCDVGHQKRYCQCEFIVGVLSCYFSCSFPSLPRMLRWVWR